MKTSFCDVVQLVQDSMIQYFLLEYLPLLIIMDMVMELDNFSSDPVWNILLPLFFNQA